jgi:hypothetical protein
MRTNDLIDESLKRIGSRIGWDAYQRLYGVSADLPAYVVDPQVAQEYFSSLR